MGSDCMGMGGDGNVKILFRLSLRQSRQSGLKHSGPVQGAITSAEQMNDKVSFEVTLSPIHSGALTLAGNCIPAALANNVEYIDSK